MSLYNLVFGMNPDTDKILSLLGKTQADFGRFRSVFLEDGYIIVHTRNGGGNREDYEDVFDEMTEHPWYSHDEDDSFDCTYANIYFKVPEGKEETLVALHNFNKGANPANQWAELIGMMEALKK
jgi:hypothetical protein